MNGFVQKVNYRSKMNVHTLEIQLSYIFIYSLLQFNNFIHYDVLLHLLQLILIISFIYKQAFKDFENLLNLHTNFHLLLHAKNYATLLNVSIGTKEMVHRIFKSIILRTNLKNV